MKTPTKRGRGRPAILQNPTRITLLVEERHEAILDAFRVERGLDSLSAALRMLIEESASTPRTQT